MVRLPEIISLDLVRFVVGLPLDVEWRRMDGKEIAQVS